MSFLIGFTPLDAPKDIADLYAGKDIITGEEVNREILFVCLFLPEIGDKGYSKNVYTDEVGLKEVKNTYVKEKSKLVYFWDYEVERIEDGVLTFVANSFDEFLDMLFEFDE